MAAKRPPGVNQSNRSRRNAAAAYASKNADETMNMNAAPRRSHPRPTKKPVAAMATMAPK
jgi:hypothetical protein